VRSVVKLIEDKLFLNQLGALGFFWKTPYAFFRKTMTFLLVKAAIHIFYYEATEMTKDHDDELNDACHSLNLPGLNFLLVEARLHTLTRCDDIHHDPGIVYALK